MKLKTGIRAVAFVLFALFFAACSKSTDSKGGEETGTKYAIDEMHDELHNGLHLVISFNATTKYFDGTVENKTSQIIRGVHVEVHLNNGSDLGPTYPVDLAPGQLRMVQLSTEGASFDRWSVNAEFSSVDGDDGDSDG